MADVIETPLRLFAELTTGGALAGRYQLEFQRRIEVNGVEIVPAAVMIKDLTAEQGAQIVGTDAANLASQVQTLSAQIAEERAASQAQVDQLTSALSQAQREAADAKAIVNAVSQAVTPQ